MASPSREGKRTHPPTGLEAALGLLFVVGAVGFVMYALLFGT